MFGTSCSLQFLCRVIHNAVLSLGERSSSQEEAGGRAGSPMNESLSLPLGGAGRGGAHARWPPVVLDMARQLGVELDVVRRHHVCELYSSGFDKMAEEVTCVVRVCVVGGGGGGGLLSELHFR